MANNKKTFNKYLIITLYINYIKKTINKIFNSLFNKTIHKAQIIMNN